MSTAFLLLASVLSAPQEAEAGARLETRWAAEVDRAQPHPAYPRPHLVRAEWRNLNGPWELAVRASAEGAPERYDERVLVPFPLESALSGVARRIGADETAWYRRTFTVPAGWDGERVVLHFGAVDWRADVRVDGRPAGTHEGGYDPFSFDVTDLLADREEHELVVAVTDPTDRGPQPRGKQVTEPHGIWYTPSTGIWQTVWIEPVPARAIARLHVDEPAPGRVRVRADVSAPDAQYELEVVARFGGAEVARARERGVAASFELETPHRWSPDDPALYELSVRLRTGAAVVDAVESYFALRTVAVRRDDEGIPRIYLDDEPFFALGLLDQGFWPDGLYTAPTDEALRYDLEVTKRLGFDLVRKHVKVEPARWYRTCDEIGLLVWQDIPSGGPYIGPDDPDAVRPRADSLLFQREAGRIVAALDPYPCIVVWVLFNEGWGQHQTERLSAWLAALDPSRLVDATSGWADRGAGDLSDAHRYPGPGMPRPDGRRALVLGEFGGLGLPLSGHTWQDEENWGYRSFADREELTAAYERSIAALPPLIARGLCAAVYTQTTDVESEVNGLLTYDRAVLKPDEARVSAVNRSVRGAPPRVETLVPTSREHAQEWRVSRAAPPAGWTEPAFDDGAWERAPGGFGTDGTPGAVVGTLWDGDELWLRRSFTLEVPPATDTVWLDVHHDEDAEVFLNGECVATLEGYTTDYVLVPLDGGTLVVGENTLAVHCRQTAGGQFIDAGLALLRER